MDKASIKLDTTENSKYKGIIIGPMQNKAHWVKIDHLETTAHVLTQVTAGAGMEERWIKRLFLKSGVTNFPKIDGNHKFTNEMRS